MGYKDSIDIWDSNCLVAKRFLDHNSCSPEKIKCHLIEIYHKSDYLKRDTWESNFSERDFVKESMEILVMVVEDCFLVVNEEVRNLKGKFFSVGYSVVEMIHDKEE